MWPSREYSLDALANVECEIDHSGTLHGRATNADPQLAVRLDGDPVPAGFWRIRVELTNAPGLTARLYPDYGNGVAEETSQALRECYVNGTHTATLYFPEPVVALRLDPHDESLPFSAGKVWLERLEARRALWLRAREALSEASSKRTTFPVESIERLINLVHAGEPRAAWTELESGLQVIRSRPHDKRTYHDWILENDPLHSSECERVQAQDWSANEATLISILMPTYNSEPRWLKRAVASVVGQSYPHWELCIADDASTSEVTLACLRELEASDERIRVEFRDVNGHISRATNTALEMARGSFIALLDHDDELHPFALHYVAESLREHPEASLVYSDEDKIDENQKRFDPYFKPDWNPELLLGQNFISHLGVYRTDLVKRLGGLRPGYEGSQDHDLALRVAACSLDGQIVHIPRVLYHWRAIQGSTALAGAEKGYAADAALRAVQGHLDRVGVDARATLLDGGGIRVRWPVRQPAPRVSIIIPTRDKVDLLRQCVASILEKTTYKDYEVLVVDNGSEETETAEYFKALQAQGARIVDWPHPFNYSALNNFASERASGDVLAFINNDIEVIDPDWLCEMVSHAMRPDVGAVGAKLFYPDGTLQHAGVVLGVHGVAAHAYCGQPGNYPGQMNRANLLQSFSAVTAACLVIQKSVFEQVGGFDTELAVAFNDIDLCLRVREAGYRNIWTPFARLYHHESASRGREDTAEKQARFQKEVSLMQARWGALLENDPSYNPNLTRAGQPFELR